MSKYIIKISLLILLVLGISIFIYYIFFRQVPATTPTIAPIIAQVPVVTQTTAPTIAPAIVSSGQLTQALVQNSNISNTFSKILSEINYKVISTLTLQISAISVTPNSISITTSSTSNQSLNLARFSPPGNANPFIFQLNQSNDPSLITSNFINNLSDITSITIDNVSFPITGKATLSNTWLSFPVTFIIPDSFLLLKNSYFNAQINIGCLSSTFTKINNGYQLTTTPSDITNMLTVNSNMLYIDIANMKLLILPSASITTDMTILTIDKLTLNLIYKDQEVGWNVFYITSVN